jgi:hypothetical protein
MPCVLLVNGNKQWKTLRPIYDLLVKENSVISVQKSMAAGLIQIAKLLDLNGSKED